MARRTEYWGKYKAEVLSISDPAQCGRVKISCPQLVNTGDLGWAEACLPPYQFFLPKVGDIVWVEFQEGKLENPIWVGLVLDPNFVRTALLNGDYTTGKNVIVNSGRQLTIWADDNVYIGSGQTIQLRSKNGAQDI